MHIRHYFKKAIEILEGTQCDEVDKKVSDFVYALCTTNTMSIFEIIKHQKFLAYLILSI